jgi:hypothetical protein
MTVEHDASKAWPADTAEARPTDLDARFPYGARAIGALIPGLVRPAFRKRSPAAAQLMLDWETIVGPAIAAVTVPRKLFSGTLSIVASGPIAMELQHLSGALIERINSHLGRIAVTRLRFMQDVVNAAPGPLPHRSGSLLADAAAEQAVADMPPGELRDALAGLGRSILGQSQTARIGRNQ